MNILPNNKLRKKINKHNKKKTIQTEWKKNKWVDIELHKWKVKNIS